MELKNEAVIQRLIKQGVAFTWDADWVGEPGVDRRRIERPDRFDELRVPLSADEWCRLCMREGDDYIGGCCSQTGFTQDVLNDIFRDSGRMDTTCVERLVEAAAGHEGHELLIESEEAVLLQHADRWDELGPLDKIFLCVAAVRPRLRPESSYGSPHLRDEPRPGLGALFNALTLLTHYDLFDVGPDGRKQLHGNVVLWLARALPAVNEFRAHLDAVFAEPWTGFAITHGDQLLRNGHGYTLFGLKREAEALLDRWRSADLECEPSDKNPLMAEYEVRPARVSADGIVLG